MGLRSALQRLRGRTPEADVPEDEEAAELPWHLHAGSLYAWTASSLERREGRGTPMVFQAGEQADCMARHYFIRHDLDALLESDETAAFVAYSISELLAYQVISSWDFLWSSGALSGLKPEAALRARQLAVAAVMGATQRITWHAAAWQAGEYGDEPFGPTVGDVEVGAHDFDEDDEEEADGADDDATD